MSEALMPVPARVRLDCVTWGFLKLAQTQYFGSGLKSMPGPTVWWLTCQHHTCAGDHTSLGNQGWFVFYISNVQRSWHPSEDLSSAWQSATALRMAFKANEHAQDPCNSYWFHRMAFRFSEWLGVLYLLLKYPQDRRTRCFQNIVIYYYQ